MSAEGRNARASFPLAPLKFSYRAFMILARRNVEIEKRPTFKQQFFTLASKGHKQMEMFMQSELEISGS